MSIYIAGKVDQTFLFMIEDSLVAKSSREDEPGKAVAKMDMSPASLTCCKAKEKNMEMDKQLIP